jgi:hypothetical protein
MLTRPEKMDPVVASQTETGMSVQIVALPASLQGQSIGGTPITSYDLFWKEGKNAWIQ